MQCRLASTPVENVDQATGDMEGTLVSSGRKTPLVGELLEVRQAPLAHELRREAGVQPVETQDHHALGLSALVGVAHRDQPVSQAQWPGEDDDQASANVASKTNRAPPKAKPAPGPM